MYSEAQHLTLLLHEVHLKLCHCTGFISDVPGTETQTLFSCHNQLEAFFPLKVFCCPAIVGPLFSFSFFFWVKVTSLFAQCCAIGVMLRVRCVICCYAATSGMRILSLFRPGRPSLSPCLCQKRTNNPVTTIVNTA